MPKTFAIPLFPLHTVLFPHGTLPLRIFEPRYLEMVSSCLKTERGFGICLIRSGSEVGKAAETYDTGTLSEITYFNQQADGLLGITAAIMAPVTAPSRDTATMSTSRGYRSSTGCSVCPGDPV